MTFPAKLQAAALMPLLLAAGGCASLKDFEAMTPDGRASFVCERHPNVASLEARISGLAAQLNEAEAAIAAGYRLREFCREEPVVTSSEEVCETDANGKKTCKTTSNVSREVVCEQKPIPIEGEFERKKIRDYRANIRKLDADADRAYSRCYDKVLPLTAEEAYDYYRSSRGDF